MKVMVSNSIGVRDSRFSLTLGSQQYRREGEGGLGNGKLDMASAVASNDPPLFGNTSS